MWARRRIEQDLPSLDFSGAAPIADLRSALDAVNSTQ